MERKFFYLLASIFLFSLSTDIPKPIYPHYVLSFGASYFMVGSVLSGLGYSRMLIEAPLGMIIDRYGRRRIAIIGGFFSVASALFGGLAIDLSFLVFSVVFSGISSSLFFASSFVMINDLTPSKKTGGFFGSTIAAIFLGSIFGPLLGGYLANKHGLRAPFVVSSIISAVALSFIFIGTREVGEKTIPLKERHRYHHLRYIHKLFNSKRLMFINLLGFLNPFIMSCIVSTVLPIYGEKQIGLDYTLIGMVFSVISISSFLVSAPSGVLSDKFGRKPLLAIGFSLFAIANFLFPYSTNLLNIIFPSILLGLGCGLISPSMWASLSDATAPEETAISIGVFRTFIAVGLIAGPTVAGVLMNPRNMDMLFYLVSLIALLATIGNIVLPKITQKDS